MQSSGAHACTAHTDVPCFAGPPLIPRCLVVIRTLSWRSDFLSPPSPLTLQVSFIEPAVIYCTRAFLPVCAIRRRVSDRLKLQVRTFRRSAFLIDGHYQTDLVVSERQETTGELGNSFLFNLVRGLWRLHGHGSGMTV